MEGKEKRSCNSLPPGFRFHPTDEELIIYYLKNQALSKPCPVSIIPEVDIYKFDPWHLPEKTDFGENEWYFFTPRDRKYPNGIRPNRATVSGYWKATGTDKAIYSATKYVGIKKALVFYKGRPPKGIKTDWIMHEYRLTESRYRPVKPHGSMRLDDWVLCRIYKKRHVARTEEMKSEESDSPQQSPLTIGFGSSGGTNHNHNHHDHDHNNQIMSSDQNQQHQTMKFPRTHSLSYLLDLDYLGPIAHMLNDNTTPGYDSTEFQTIMGNNINNPGLDPNVGPFLSQLNSQHMYGSGSSSNFK